MSIMKYPTLCIVLLYWNQAITIGYELPTGTDVNATTLDLQSSGITTIDSFPDMPFLDILKLQSNLLEAFPNVTSLANTITWLWLDYNKISSVDPVLLGALIKLDRLYLKHNFLKTLPTIDTPSALKNLYLDGNPLEELPPLGEFGARVTWLEISDTGLDYINPTALAGYRNTLLVNMRNNGYTRWPDFSPIAGSFVQVDLRGNAMRSISLREILPTPKLRSFRLNGPALTRLPNLCHTPLSGAHWVGDWDFSLHCDCHMRWLKMALGAGKVRVWAGTPKCASPPALAGKNIADLPITDFVCGQESSEYYDVKQIVTPSDYFSCVIPSVTEVVPADSLVSCSMACIAKPGCNYFSLTSGDPFTPKVCGLTNVFSLASLDSTMNPDVITNATASWYTVD